MAVRELALAAREASRSLAVASGAVRNQALEAIARAMEANEEQILAANARDMAAGEKLIEQGELDLPLLKRLDLSGRKFASTVEMVRSVQAQPDPLGRTQSATELDERLNLYRVTVPIGVIGVIFESRPDALVQIASICLKSGNAALLKGGREATETNRALAAVREARAMPPGDRRPRLRALSKELHLERLATFVERTAPDTS